MPGVTPSCASRSSPALATVRGPVAVVATVVLAALLALAVLADPVVLAAGLAWAGVVLAWGWPTLHGSSSRFGSSLAIGTVAVLAPTAAALPDDEPFLRLVPVAVIAGLAVMFVHQMVRTDGRPRLTDSIAVTSFGIAAVTLASPWVPLTRSEAAVDLAVVALTAIAASSLADLVAGMPKVRPWMLPLAMLLGGGGGPARGHPARRPGLRSCGVDRASSPPPSPTPYVASSACCRPSGSFRRSRVGRGEPARARGRRVRAVARPRRLIAPAPGASWPAAAVSRRARGRRAPRPPRRTPPPRG